MEISNYSPAEISEILRKYGTRQLSNSESEIFTYGNSVLKKFQKKGVLSEEIEHPGFESSEIPGENLLICDIQRCNKRFSSIHEFEDHWRLNHYFICATCGKNLPSDHLLNLHILESHDTIFEIQKESKAMFCCFIEKCPEKFLNPEMRKDHCIKIHGFRSDFKYEIQQRKKPVNCEEKMDTSGEKSKGPPKFFHFGHGGQKTFKFTKKPKGAHSSRTKELGQYKDPLEEMSVDLKEHLPDV